LYEPGDAVPAEIRAALDDIDRIHSQEMTEHEFRRYEAWETREHVIFEITPESATWFDLGRAEMGRTGEASERPIGPAGAGRTADR
jgi:hypothetical protein